MRARGPRIGAVAFAAAGLAALAVSACARAPVTEVARTVGEGGHYALSVTAAGVALRASEAASSAVASSPVVPVLDVLPWLGKPLRRAPWATRKVAITLDDGPSVHTAEVLSILERAGVRATFFYVGSRSPRYRDLVHRAAGEGFEVGDHTWDHQEVRGVGYQRVLDQIDRTQVELTAETGVRPIFVRPPAGHWDDATLRAITDRGLIMALWSLHGQDTGPGTHADVIARDVLAAVHGGDVILLHETNPQTVQALPVIIAGLQAKGLEPVTLSALLTR